MSKHGYRYFPEDFPPGHVVTPKADHFCNLAPDKQKAEAAIRAGSTRGNIRANSVFVFESRQVAENLLHETDGKHLYEVRVEEKDILCRADLRIYDEIVERLKEGKAVDALVKEFWEGAERPSPRIELTVRKVVINRKLIDDDLKWSA
jgi:hypothetical protein